MVGVGRIHALGGEMSEQKVLPKVQSSAILNIVQVADKELAKQLAAHHLALAQVYRRIAGEQPILTGSQQRKQAARVNR